MSLRKLFSVDNKAEVEVHEVFVGYIMTVFEKMYFLLFYTMVCLQAKCPSEYVVIITFGSIVIFFSSIFPMMG